MDRKEYLRNYQRNWIAKRRAAFFLDKICLQCGTNNNLELHHRDPNEKVSHVIWSWSKERQLKEIEKCDILCHKCHWDETRKQFNYGIYLHGTTTCYSAGCRCQLCKDKIAQDQRNLRKLGRTKAERINNANIYV